jgi:hypothetical protein
MFTRHFVFSSLLLLATLPMSGVATAATSSQPSPSPVSIPSPGPSASPPISPAGTADPSPSAEAGICTLFEDADVAGFLGAELISVTEMPAQGRLIGGCEAIATNSVSLTLRLHDASEWDEFITSFGNESVPTLSNAYYSDITGLSYLAPNGDTYIAVSLRPGFGVNDHIRALYLLLGR